MNKRRGTLGVGLLDIKGGSLQRKNCYRKLRGRKMNVSPLSEGKVRSGCKERATIEKESCLTEGKEDAIQLGASLFKKRGRERSLIVSRSGNRREGL